MRASRRPSLRSAADSGDARIFSWRMLAEGHGVLEGDARQTPSLRSSLTLHVVLDPEEDVTVAWWETNEGIWLAQASVGLA